MAVTTPLPELSVRLAGRNQTFTAGAPAAVVLLPQLINNGHPIVARHGRTGSRIVRNLLNPATSALLPFLPRNCGFRFLVGSGNLSGKSVWAQPGASPLRPGSATCSQHTSSRDRDHFFDKFFRILIEF